MLSRCEVVINTLQSAVESTFAAMNDHRSYGVGSPYIEEIMRQVDSVLEKFLEDPNISKLTDLEILHLPLSLVLKIAPSEITRLMERRGIREWKYERCLEHYNKGRTQIDGPPPLRMNCGICRMNDK